MDSQGADSNVTNKRECIILVKTYTFDAVVHISDVICVSLNVQKFLHKTVKHLRHAASVICR